MGQSRRKARPPIEVLTLTGKVDAKFINDFDRIGSQWNCSVHEKPNCLAFLVDTQPTYEAAARIREALQRVLFQKKMSYDGKTIAPELMKGFT